MSTEEHPRSRRSRGMVVAAVAALVAAFALACGLSVIGSGDPIASETDEAGLDGSASDALLDPSDADGGNAPEECLAPRVVCDGLCTDPLADPSNCSACGKTCASGDTCEDGGCAVLCLAGTLRCDNQCINPKTNPVHCGACGVTCAEATPFCVEGACVPDCGATTLCGADAGADAGAPYCADTQVESMNCGACGLSCLPNEVCETGVCKALCAVGSKPGDVFAPNMIGCIGKVSFSNRGSLCPPGAKACSASQWVQRRAAKAPSYNYWTDDNLGYYGKSYRCLVDTKNVYGCGSSPMRVCKGRTDALGNQCTWTDCGYKTYDPNEEFGGCYGNPTAGTLCCN